jgi:hypothetical protein
MIVFLAAVALVIVAVYFLTIGRRPDENWQRFRRRFRERIRRPPPEPGADSPFRFDRPSTDVTEVRRPSQGDRP